VMLAAATSVGIGEDEMKIANALEPQSVARCKTVGIDIPASAEIVLEGRMFMEPAAKEGMFVDITGTYDIVREQPTIEIKKMTMRKDAIFHALIPSAGEHRVLMGMPREPTIYNEVNKACKCTNAYLTEGGCSWLHGVVQIDKKHESDGRKAIEAAFVGHGSLKHVVVVDKDIDIFSPSDVEWAIATRVQANKALVVKANEKGSSLDPSSDPNTRITTKVGIDATKPVTKGEHWKFEKAEFPKVRVEDYL
jgi:2,5-furandicarboxylate decarboxylase 1